MPAHGHDGLAIVQAHCEHGAKPAALNSSKRLREQVLASILAAQAGEEFVKLRVAFNGFPRRDEFVENRAVGLDFSRKLDSKSFNKLVLNFREGDEISISAFLKCKRVTKAGREYCVLTHVKQAS